MRVVGRCTVGQVASIDGQTTTNSQSGGSVNTNTTCIGPVCNGDVPTLGLLVGPVCANAMSVARLTAR